MTSVIRRGLARGLCTTLLLAAATAPATAQTTIATYAGGATNTSGLVFIGQSFTPTGAATYGSIVVSFQNAAGANVGSGSLYLFASPYAGAPNALATAPGALGSAAFDGARYAFAPGVALNGGTTYYAYADTRFVVGISDSAPAGPYADGQAYTSPNPGIAFTARSIGDFRFAVTGVDAAPEPATWGLMILGFGAVGGMLRRRPAATRRTASA